MEWRTGGIAAAALLCLVFFCKSAASEEDLNIVDNEQSRKLLGSSVVTSVSVIMEHGNGSKTVIKEGGGGKPQIVGTPGSFLSPDRYEFYSLDDSGDLVKRLMSLEEIQSLIAASRPELAAPSIPVYYHRPLVEPDIADEGVQNVLANVQSVLREELAKERDPPKPQPLPIDDSWSLLLPGLFGADLDFKQEPMLSRPERPTSTAFPTTRPTTYSTINQKPTYAEVSHGTTFGVLPPFTHSQTTVKPLSYSTSKPVKYSAHYTTVKNPPLQEISHPSIPQSTKPPFTTNRPSTIIHYLPIQSINPSVSQQSIKTTSKPEINKNKFTTLPPVKKTTPIKLTTKTTTYKPTTLDYNFNKTYQRITVKPLSNSQPNPQTNKPIKSQPSQKPSASLYSTTTLTSSSVKPTVHSSPTKPTIKPYIKTTKKPEDKPFTEYQIIETVGTRKPPLVLSSTTVAPVKKPLPTKSNSQYSSLNKNPTSKPSLIHKPHHTTKPSSSQPSLSISQSQPAQKIPPQKYTKPVQILHQPTTPIYHKTEPTPRSTVRPSINPIKITATQTPKPIITSSAKPMKTTQTPNLPSTTFPPTSAANTVKISSTTSASSMGETIELIPITQDDEVMASSAAALIQDLLRTETNKDHFSNPTSSHSTTDNLISSSSATLTQFSSTAKPTTMITRITTAKTKPSQVTSKPKVTSKPYYHSTESLIKLKSTSPRPIIPNKTTLTNNSNKYESTKKPFTTAQKPISHNTIKPSNTRPSSFATKKPQILTTTLKPLYSIASKPVLSGIKSEALTQAIPSNLNATKPSIQKKPTEITLIPINDLKKYSSLSQLIDAKPEIIKEKITTTVNIPSTTVPTTEQQTEEVTMTTLSMTTNNDNDKVPSNDFIDSDMIYQVISTLQSNTNKITYPTTIGDYITNTVRTFSTEGTPTVTSTSTVDTTETVLTTETYTNPASVIIKNYSNNKISTTDKYKEFVTSHTNKLSYTEPSVTEGTMTEKSFTAITKPGNIQNNKKDEKVESTSKASDDITSTSAFSETQPDVASTPYGEATSTVAMNFEEVTGSEFVKQDSTTNLLDDEAIQEGISAVANILLDDTNMMRRLGKPDILSDVTSTSIPTTGDIQSTTTDYQDTTTDFSLFRMDIKNEDFDPTDLSTTIDPDVTTTTELVMSTLAEDFKSGERENEEVMLNDEVTTLKVTTEASTTTTKQPLPKIPIKITANKIKTHLTPTKESKLNPDDPIELEMSRLTTTKPQPKPTAKVNITSNDKLTKPPSSKPNKYTSPKPNRLPSEKPNKISTVKPNKTASTNINATNPVKVELKNVLNDKFFKKPGINSYQPNVQPPPAIDLHPAPQESLGLEASTAFLQEDIKKFSDLLNELGFRLWTSISGKGGISSRSFVLSPFAATSMLAMVFLGARGPTSGQMNDVLRLDDMVTFNPHQVLKNVTESVINSKNLGVATASFVRELYSDKFKGKILDFYKERVHQYYDGHVEEVNFNAIGDIVRRRTNLLVKRQTLGKLPEYLRGSSLNMRPPLAAFTANIFQSDCEAASTEGRDGEMYFVVRPSTRQRRLVPVPAVVWRNAFLAGYEPSLDATSVCLGADSVVSTILVLPGQQGQVAPGDGLARLEQRLIETSFRRGGWSKLLRSLLPRPGLELQLPRFSHRSVLNITQALRHMGLKDLFTSRADLRGLNGVSNDLHLSDMVQVNTFSTCGEEKVGARHHTETYPSSAIRIGRKDEEVVRKQRGLRYEGEGSVIRRQRQARITEDWLPLSRGKRSADVTDNQDEQRFDDEQEKSIEDSKKETSFFDDLQTDYVNYREEKQLRLTETPRLRFDRPFLYMIRHNPTGIILHMGRFNPRLLP